MSETEKTFSILQLEQDRRTDLVDSVSVEEPLELRVVAGAEGQRRSRSLAITMRTPGHDIELAIGFLYTEGVIQNREQIVSVELCGPVEPGRDIRNTVVVELTAEQQFEFHHLQRHFYMTSSCGICGKASLEILERRDLQPVPVRTRMSHQMIYRLPQKMRQLQDSFRRTGGIHAAALFNGSGEIQALREDVGRHNAMDKLIGDHLQRGMLPAGESVLVVSGRASFELLQKALSASVPIFVAVGAPSSLAVELAEKFNITLIGFTTDQRCNIYTHPARVI